MKELEIIEKIEQFLEGKLPPDEHKQFEELIRNDKEVSNLFLCYTQAIEEIKTYSRNELKERLKTIQDQQIPNTGLLFRVRRSIPLRIAAIIVGFALLSLPVYLYFSSNMHSKSELLFDSNFSPYMNITTQRGGEEIPQSSILQNAAMHFYNNHEYNNAIINFEELLKSQNKTDSLILFYYGISCLGAKNHQKAIEVFTKLISNKNYILYEQSKWYLALSYLKISNKELTRQTLNEIIEEKGEYTSKALHLLEDLN